MLFLVSQSDLQLHFSLVSIVTGGNYIRESVDSLCRDGADAQYTQYLIKQKPYNFTTNTQKAYLSIQASCLSAFVISKTHISGQKLRGRQLNKKVCDSKSAIFVILLSSFFFVQTTCQATITRKLDFSTKLMLVRTRSFPTTQRLHSFKFTLVNKSHSQHSVVAVRSEGRHFLILYACAHEVLFPGQIPRSLVWERH